LNRIRERIQVEGAVSQKSIDKINLALGSDDSSLGARLAVQLREDRIDSEQTEKSREANESENSIELHVQMIDMEIASIKELKIKIEAEEDMSEEANLDSLAIPEGHSGINILRYEGAIRRQISADCKELNRLQERRLFSIPLKPSQGRSGIPSLN
jgi:hypothetical protein